MTPVTTKPVTALFSWMALSALSANALAFEVPPGHAVVQLGGYWSSQGASQHININGLVGDNFTVTSGQSSNGLVGLGYFMDGQARDFFKMTYGVNAFYLAPTGVSGQVVQENLFTNLSYRYNITHYPVYAVAKSAITTRYLKHDLTLDVDIGPNFMRSSGFREQSLDGGITLPDHAFSSHTTTTFTAMVGAGLKFANFFGQAPLECGYKFYYLGQGHLNTSSNQIQNRFSTGSDYANAVMCSISV